MTERNRFEEALFINAGACNGVAIVKALARAYEAAHAEGGGTDAINADPAVQLILHQLCHLARMNVDDGWQYRDNPRIFSYERAERLCIERCGNPATIELLGLTGKVRATN